MAETERGAGKPPYWLTWGICLTTQSGSVLELLPLNQKVEGSILALAVTCRSVPGQNTEPQSAPTDIQRCVEGYGCVSIN